MTDAPTLPDWQARPRPIRQSLAGRTVRLEPIAASHAAQLFEAMSGPENSDRFTYLFDTQPTTEAEVAEAIARAALAEDVVAYAVVDQATGRAEGRQQFMRIEPGHGVIELGAIYWGPRIARRVQATEAFYLAARHVFEDLGYRRFEWKCDSNNRPSRRAAERFGFTFEGVFRQHMVLKGRNRDTAWYSMLDHEWPGLRAAFDRWLDPVNFDRDGVQKTRLDAWK